MKKLALLFLLLTATLSLCQSYGADPAVVQLPFMNIDSGSANLSNWSLINAYSGVAIDNAANSKVRFYFAIESSVPTGIVDIDDACVVTTNHGSKIVKNVYTPSLAVSGYTTPPWTGLSVPTSGTDPYALCTTSNPALPQCIFKSTLLVCATGDCKYPFDLYIAVHFANSTNNTGIHYPWTGAVINGSTTQNDSGFSYGQQNTDWCSGLTTGSTIYIAPSGSWNPVRFITQVANN